MGRGSRSFVSIVSIGLALAWAGCGRGEIKGTYAVELEIAGVPTPLTGTLVLSTQPLDIPSLSESDTSIDPSWFGGDAIAANSCFVLDAGRTATGATGEPGIVRVFEARMLPDGVRTPIEILNASDLRIEISRLEFFANALGGELDVHTDRGVRPGRIHGVRSGSASSQQCVEALDAFRSFLRESAAEAEPTG